jgi:uncharacterized repeat protein (TIGR03803 family)
MKHVASTWWLSVLVLLCGCGSGEGTQNGPPPPNNPPPPQVQAYTVLHTFKEGPEGKSPFGGLIRDEAGNLYGTTSEGGDLACPDDVNGCGTVFKLEPNGAFRTLHVFAGGQTDGAGPQAGLIRDLSGNLYGTTAGGGNRSCTQGCGTVFKLDATGSETVLHRFTGGTGGSIPELGVRDAAGNLYGTTQFGGDLSCPDEPGFRGCGTVFKLAPGGTLTTLHVFAGGADHGSSPQAGPIRDASGNLYGATFNGGDCLPGSPIGCGTVFKIDRDGVFTTLHRFAGFPTDGAGPDSGLVQDASGNLYGTTIGGGAQFGGTVFQVDSSGQTTILHSFTSPEDEGFDDPGGQSPNGVLPDAFGNLYGTTSAGGVSLWGVIFRLNVESGVKIVLHTFSGKADGGQPFGTPVGDSAGNLYGATFAGGDLSCNPPYGCGVVFRLKLP